MPLDPEMKAYVDGRVNPLEKILGVTTKPEYLPSNTATLNTTPPTRPLPPGAVAWLPDGTPQFGNAPTGTNPDGSPVNTVPNTTPPVPPEFKVGARIRTKGFPSQPWHTIIPSAAGEFIRAVDAAGNIIEGLPSQYELEPTMAPTVTPG